MVFIFFSYNFVLTIFFSKFKKKFKILDKPSKKKIHKKTGYLIGGIFIFLNLMILLSLNEVLSLELFKDYEQIQKNKILFFTTGSILFLIGLFDDKFSLNPYVRLILLFLTIFAFLNLANEFIIHMIYFESLKLFFNLNDFSLIFTLISIILLIQIFNFFDGIDLQLSLYVIFLSFYLFIVSKSLILLAIILIMIFNLYLNSFQKIFLGDAGVYLITFILSIFIIVNYNQSKINSEEVFLMLLIPFLDFVRLFFIRICEKKNPMIGDLKHIHHLIIKKIGLYKTLLIIGLLYMLPLLMYIYLHNFFTSISLGAIGMYSATIYYFTKNNKIT
jgi:UDP-GlcNAc:undecaprenyl-phosphate GlcNAc-1-phosphate transferase